MKVICDLRSEFPILSNWNEEGLYPGGLISGIKKKCFETSHGSVDRNTFLS